MNALERVEAARGALKVFPLPSAVLFPHTVLPLHIFEPRYRALVRDALEGDKVMAIAALRPGWEEKSPERPPLQPLVCAGLIVWHEVLGDGRYNLLLRGICRGRVREELPTGKLYREVLSEPLPDEPYHGPEEEQLRQLIFELAGRVPASFAEGFLPVAARMSGGALADVVAGALVPEAERRQELLAELDVQARLRAVLGEVSELVTRLMPAKPTGPLN